MAEMLAAPFMQRALIAGLIVALVASYYGVFVVQRRMAFLGHGLAHAAFGGVALGLLLGVQPLAVALPFTVAVALAVVWIGQRSAVREDTAIGVMLSLSMALGVLFLSLRHGFGADAYSFLFGSVLAIDSADLIAAGVLLALSACTLPLWGPWAYATFDRESARVDGVRVARDDYILAVMVALTVAVAVKVVGAVLVSAFLVIPAAAARHLARRFSTMTLVAAAVAAATAIAGLALSWLADVPSGAAIILVQCAAFGLALAAGGVARPKTRR